MKEKMLAAITSEVLKYKECDPELLGEMHSLLVGRGFVLVESVPVGREIGSGGPSTSGQ